MELPLGLKTALQSGRAILFVGAGIGFEAFDADGHHAPTGSELAAELAERFHIDHSASADLQQIAQIVELRKGREELIAYLTKRLSDLEPSRHVQTLLARPWGAIFTTNYDRVIERAYELLATPPQRPVPISATSQLRETDPRFEVPVYHIHGSLFSGEQPDILITQGDYAQFSERRRMLFELLKQQFATSPFLYVGYSQEDPNWRTLQSEMRAEFAPALPPRSYRVAPTTDPLDIELLDSAGIETIQGDIGDLATATLPLSAEDTMDRLKQLEESVPPVLSSAFDENPAAVARLLSSWELVNGAAFDADLNVEAFLAGDLPTWPLAASDKTFTRDVEAPLYDELVDYATSSASRPTTLLLLGSAGYGVTTVLMKAAARLVQDQAGFVLMHRRGTPLVQGDVEYAVSVLGPRPFFIIDNAADEGAELIGAVRRLRERNAAGCFLLGDRVNEWRQRSWRLSPTEFEIDALSDREVGGLLSCLERNAALGELEPLSPALREAAVKEKHEKQLLVVLRELIEGNSFDAIIEDEYRAIAGDREQLLYAAVCGFYRLRVPVRLDVLGVMLDLTTSELYEAVGPSLEGIVRLEPVDEDKGIYAARARHQVIAEIIWERLVPGPERDHLLQECLDALNLSYVLDEKAFEAFVRDDAGVDAIGTFEGRVRFFDRAVLKDPDNPYVLQHYARMLLRENRAELALAVIEQAIELRPRTRVLHHTKGVILKDIALRAPSLEIARRRLAQSESSLRDSFGPQKRDAYAYQALAELYLGWAIRSEAVESAYYVTKAEETIREGLQKADDREGLWIVSARVEEYLGNRPEAAEALKEAIRQSPASPVPRYLLARMYGREGKWAVVLSTLESVLEADPQEFRCAILYARALERTGAPYSEAIAVLRLADLFGQRDARFVATLGGMMIMNGDLSEAAAVFGKRRESISYKASQRIEYRPRPNDVAVARLEGSVTLARAGYAFIRAPGSTDYFCPGPEMRGRDVSVGNKASFAPAFTARGPIAVDVMFA